jgi:Zn finger protein HypA/HybF involved in hydrogenase expression
MEDLTRICQHLGYPGCHPKIVERFFDLEITQHHKKPTELPLEEERIKLSEICKQCQHGHFEIRANKCPACGSNHISSRLLSSFGVGSVKPSHNTYFYESENCGAHLYSYKQL